MESVVVVLESELDVFVPTDDGTFTTAVAKFVTSCEPFVVMLVEPVGDVPVYVPRTLVTESSSDAVPTLTVTPALMFEAARLLQTIPSMVCVPIRYCWSAIVWSEEVGV